MIKIKSLLVAACIVAPTVGNAGLISFGAGATAAAAVISATGSSDSNIKNTNGTLLASTNGNVVVCKALNPKQCYSVKLSLRDIDNHTCIKYFRADLCARRSDGSYLADFYLDDYVRFSGFNSIVSRSILIQGDVQYHVLEVK